jgi:hypothetical protein
MLTWSFQILYCGLPGASILAVELLKQTSQQSNTTTFEQDEELPRAEVIRSLSVFISLLDMTVYRGDVHQKSCAWARQVLSCILDEIIEPQPRTHYPAVDLNQQPAAIPIPMDDWQRGNPMNVDDFLDWVEGVDWNLIDGSTCVF